MSRRTARGAGRGFLSIDVSWQNIVSGLATAKLNLERSVRSPVNGFVTNLTATAGDQEAGMLALVAHDSLYVDGFPCASLSRPRRRTRRRHVGDRRGAPGAGGPLIGKVRV